MTLIHLWGFLGLRPQSAHFNIVHSGGLVRKKPKELEKLTVKLGGL